MAEQNKKQKGQEQVQDVNQLLKVRREKLAALQEAGKDPFQITKYDVTHHSSDVKELYTKQLGDVLKYVEQMNEVDTSNVKPMTQVIDFCNVMREDKVVQEISKEALMANAPEEENGFFKVPKIN